MRLSAFTISSVQAIACAGLSLLFNRFVLILVSAVAVADTMPTSDRWVAKLLWASSKRGVWARNSTARRHGDILPRGRISPPHCRGRFRLGSRREPFESVMKVADPRGSDNLSRIRWTGRTRFWAVLGERQLGPGSTIIIEVGRQDPTQVTSAASKMSCCFFKWEASR